MVKSRKRNRSKNRAAPEPKGKRRLITAMRAALRLAMALAVIALMAFGANAGYEAAVDRGYFEVKRIEVTGLSVVSEESVKELIGPVIGRNTFDLDLKKAGGRIKAHPWIKTVEMRRELPSALAVRVVERRPVGVADLGEHWLVDEDGVLLREVEEGKVWGLPVLKGLDFKGDPHPGAAVDAFAVREAMYVLEKLGGYKLMGKKKIAGVDVSPGGGLEVFFDGSETRLIAPRSSWTDETDRLRVVDHILRKKDERVKAIDLTFADKVIVTRPDASAGYGGDA